MRQLQALSHWGRQLQKQCNGVEGSPASVDGWQRVVSFIGGLQSVPARLRSLTTAKWEAQGLRSLIVWVI